jgi:predicted nucleic acid-binding protein
LADAFVDTACFAAILDRRDSLSGAAFVALESLNASKANLVTSEAVLIELLTYFSNRGFAWRGAVVEYVDALRKGPVRIVPQTPELFDAGFALYRDRPDKTYRMVDCISMVICRRRNITDVVTSDRDFEREGFRILLPSGTN